MQLETLALTAVTVTSALGHGRAAAGRALREGRSGLRPNDFDGAGWIGRVEGLEHHRLPAALAGFDCRNNRLADLALRQDGFEDAVRAAIRRYGAERIAVVLGTSTSGVLACEEAFAARQPDGRLPPGFDYDRTHDMFSAARYLRAALGLAGPAMVVSIACASSGRSLVDGANLIAAGLCDAAVVGGVDSLCHLTLRGFTSLELIAPGPCRPCDAERDGISIGEAAGFALLERGEGELRLLGAATSSDGYHMSAPHPQGAGALAAMHGALGRAAPGSVDWVSLHGTATRANDAMEDTAVHAVFGPDVPVSSTKGWTGHTLGTCGILGVALAAEVMRSATLPPCLGMATPDPGFRCRVLTAPEPRRVRRVMVNAFGFGGVNCALLLEAA